MKKRGIEGLLAALVVMAVLAALLLLHGKNGKDIGKAVDAGTEPRATVYTLTISKEAQKAAGIAVEPLKPGLHRMEVTAYGKVLDAEGINASRRLYVTATSGLEKAEAVLKASEKEYARMKNLNAKAKNVSDRALQTAAAQLASDRAEDGRARGELQSARDEISLKWGTTLSGWIFDYSLPLRNVLAAKDVLVQVTAPPAASLPEIARTVTIETPAGLTVPATFVSRATATDPKIQGISFIYLAPSSSGRLLPGMDVTTQMPSGGTETGFVVPFSSVVWLQDKAWVYLRESETGFVRVEVPTSASINKGYFVSAVFSPGDKLVVKGAQAVLSEESIPRTTGGGGEEDED